MQLPMQLSVEDLKCLLELGVSPEEVARLAATEFRLNMWQRHLLRAGMSMAVILALTIAALKLQDIDPAEAPAVMSTLLDLDDADPDQLDD